MGWAKDALQAAAGGGIGTAINAGLGGMYSAIAGGWQDKRQLKQQERLMGLQMKGQREMQDYANEKQLEMWEKTGVVGQMEQIKKAGLNPAMMYGGGGAGGATVGNNAGMGVSGADAAKRSGSEAEAVMSMGLQAQMMQAQIELLKSQANKNNVDAGKAAGVDTDLVNASISNIRAKTGNIQADTQLKDIDRRIKEVELDLKNATFNDVVNEIYQESKEATQQTEMIFRRNKIEKELFPEMIASTKAELASVGIKNELMRAQTANTEEGTKLTSQQITESLTKVNVMIKNYMLAELQSEFSGRTISETERNNAHYRMINDISASTKLSVETVSAVLKAANGAKL